MNHVYRVIWNEVLGTWQAVAEVARGRGKTKSQSQTQRQSGKVATGATVAALSAVALGTAALLGVTAVWAQAALPTGGTVVAGTGSISQSGAVLTVTQGSAKLAADWQSFNIGQGNTVNFVQPSASAVALNRVLGTDVSVIQGALNANGQVFLVNPNGVLFTPTAQVNVGSIVASTLNISTADFMVGNYKFDSGSRITGEGQAAINQGNIVATGINGRGGSIALIAARIINTGTLSAPGGNVLLGAGSKVTLDLGGPIKLRVEQGALDALISNGGAIRVDGGLVYMSAKAAGDLTASVINHSGVVDASSLTSKGGRIVLEADSVNLQAGSRLDARGATSGGAVEVHAQTLQQSGSIDASGVNTGGTINVQATVITLTTGATVSAKGDAVGGQVRLQADTVLAEQAVVDVSADADAGVGGNIDVSSNGALVLQDTQLLASGALQGGQIRLSDASPTPNPAEPDAQPDTPPGAPVPAPDAPRVAVLGNTVISSRSRSGQAGSVVLTGDSITLGTGSQIDATGATGGGTVLVGGGWQGSGNLRQATTVTMEAGASIDVSATQNGDGGTAVLWSDLGKADSLTVAQGTIHADAGAQGGNGGRIETSGHRIAVDGIAVSAVALHGQSGEWLLDPYNITIGGSTATTNVNSGTYNPTADNSQIQASTISSALNGGTNVTVQTGTSGSQAGTITVTSAITKSGGGDATLTLQAADSITVNAAISSTSNKLHVNLLADNDLGTHNGVGAVLLNNNITTNGGAISFGNGDTLTINSVSTKVGGDVYAGTNTTGGSINLDTRIGSGTTGGGAITVNGEMLIGNTVGLDIKTGGGNAVFGGLLNSGNAYTYVAVGSGNTWSSAKTAAKSGSGDGTAVGDGYLATVTSRLENAIAGGSGNYATAWLGGVRGGNGSEGASADWYWVTGPEGLANAARGTAFFTQTGNGTGNAVNSAYLNWNGGEPNNSGGANYTSGTGSGEMTLQFQGSNGQWNDLAWTSTSPAGYVKETNLAASKLTINAGAGTVTFQQSVGSQKALGDINITAGSVAVTGGSITTEGSQTYNGNVGLLAADVQLLTKGPSASSYDILFNNGITKSGAGDVTLTVKSHRDILVKSDIAATGGKLNLQLEADYENNGSAVSHDGAGFIQINNNITTNGGAIQLGNGATTNIDGSPVKVGGDLYLAGSTAQTFATAGGAFTVKGETLIANAAGVAINTAGGVVTFDGVVNSANSYTFVAKTVNNDTWGEAKIEARGATGGGSATGDTYLATTTSRLENSIASRAANYQTAWLGGSRGGVQDSNQSDDWYWVTGPEAAANSGRGTLFFMQTAAQAGTTPVGGTAVNGSYVNWNVGGSGRSEPNSINEDYLQMVGNKGLWNDLSDVNTSPDGYIQEKNLAPSALSINAGSAAVSFNGAMGGSKALASLTVLAGSTTVSGSALVTTGAQTYNNALSVASTGDLQVSATTLSVTNASQAATFKAAGNITQSNGMVVTTNGGNAIYWADSDASGNTTTAGGSISVSGGSITTGGGQLVMAGGADSNADGTPEGFAIGAAGGSSQWGISIAGTTLNAGTGDILLRGQSTGTYSDTNIGVRMFNGSVMSVTSGNFTAVGLGSIKGTSSSNNNWGVSLEGVNVSASGNVSITGTGGTSTTGDGNHGVLLGGIGGTIATTAIDKSITITGTGGSGGNNHDGVTIQSLYTVGSATTGAISITGSATSNTGSTEGVSLQGKLHSGASGTAISVNGTSTGVSAGNGIYATGMSVQATGSGGISMTGSTQVPTYPGVYVQNSDVLAASGPIVFNGGTLGVELRSSTVGKKASTLVTSSSSDVTFTGDKVTFTGANTVDTTGKLTVQPSGTSFANALSWSLANLTLASGVSGLTLGKAGNLADITIASATSIAGPIAIYGGNINLNANLTSTLSGAAILAKASGSITQAASVAVTANNGSVTYWADSDATTDGFIWLKSASSIASAGGNITLSGGSDVTTGYAQGSTSTNSSGILLDAATITSSGGNVLIRGKGTAGSAVAVSTSLGSIDNTNGVRTIGSTGINSGSGTLTMNGVAQGLNSSNGIELSNSGTTTLQSSNASASAISLTGTSSNASASNGFGIYTWTASILATGGGGITLNGTGAKNAGVVVATTSKVLANSGLISLQGTGASSGASASAVEVYGTVGKLAATPVIASTSNIEVLADSVYFSSGVFDTTGTVTIAPKTISNSFSSPLNLTSGLAISSGVTGLTLGKASNTADITISNATSIAGPISIYGGDITINAGLQATNNSTITLQGTGNVIDGPSGFVDALYLRLLGGNVTLDNASNAVGYLAASGVGNLTYLDSDTLVINTIDGTAGVSATGVVNIGTLVGNLTLLNDVSTTNASTTAVGLNADINASSGTSTGGNLFIFDGSVVNVGAGGTALLFSGSVADSGGLTSLVGSGSNRFRYNSDEATTNYNTALGAGLYAIYREQPSATVAVDSQTITYGDALTLTGATSGLLNGDAAVYAITSALYSTSNNIRASGSPYAVTQTNLAGLGYNLTTNTAGTLTVNTKALTLSGFAANATKVYDGATTATISNAGSLSGLVGSDVVTAANTGATYDNKNVGTGKTVTLNGVSLTSTDAGNYSISNTATATADITTKALTISGITAAGKTYDGNTTATVSTSGASYGGLVGGDSLAVAATGVFNNKNAAAGKTVTLSSSYSGADVGNYAITDQASTTANITAKALSVTANAVSKTYDGTTNAVGTTTVGALASGDSVNAAAVLAFTNKDAGTANKTVQASGMTIQDASNADMSANYALTYVDNTVSTITPAALTVQANDDARFVGVADTVGYNGVSYSGLVNGETAGTGGTAGLTGTLAIARSGGNTAAGSYTGVLGASGLSATNYTITYANGDYTIVPANQLLVKVTNVANIYGTATTYAVSEAKYLATDGSTIVDLLSGVSASGNTITISDGSSGSATFTIAPSEASTGGAGLLNAGNYALAAIAITESSPNFSNNLVLVGTHSVAQKGLAATATGVSKVYDGNTSMTGVSLGLTGKEAGDVVTVSGSGAFASKNVGNANLAYTISNLALGGGDGNNYYLPGGATLVGTDGTITQKVLTVSGITAAGKTYDGSATAVVSTTGASYGGLVNGDSLTVAATGVFNDKNAAAAKTVTLTSSYTGADTGNYSITDQASTTADISRLNTVTWVGPSTGDWFDPANWAGGAVPDLSNVANVVIPSGVIVTFGTAVVAPAQSGVVNVDGIGNAGGLNVTGGTLNVGTGGVVVDNFTQTGGSLATAGNFTANQSFSQGGGGSVVVAGNTSITDTSGGIVLGNLSTGGNLNVTSQGGAIVQANGTTIATTGATALDASNGPSRYDITLNSATNDFGGAVNVIGANVSVADANALTLGAVNTTGDLTVNSIGVLDLGTSVVGGNLNANSGNGNITQAGALTVNGSSTLNAGAGNIALANPANDFVGVVNTSGNNVALVDANALTLGVVTTSGDLSVGSTGALDLGTSTVGGSLAANSGNGNITQTGALAIAGASQLAAGTGSIALNSAANDFVGAVNVQGTNVSLTDANALTIGAANASGNLTLVSTGNLTLGTTTVAGSLSANSSLGSIAQTGVRRVNGVTTMTAPSGTIPQDVEFAGAAAGAIQNAQQMASNISAFGPGSGAAADNLNNNAIQVTQVSRNLLGLSNVRVVRGGIRLPEGVAPLEEVEAR